MPSVEVRDGALWVGPQRVPLFAGEVHYWRLSPARWPDVLARVRQLGLDVVATYIPWQYHELAPGRFDFRGDTEPQRNLVGFLELLQREGFWIFIRPGPFIYAEWINAGVPDRVVGLPRLSAEYRAAAHTWMRAVTETLRPFFATHGGRIVLLQPDNEMDLFSHWFEDPCGLSGDQPGFFQQFLASAYPDVAALNAAWGTHYADLSQAQPLATRPNAFDAHTLTRHKDYWRFQHWATAEGIRWHAETYRTLGVDLPLVANYYPGGDVQNWRVLAPHVDLCGIDWYPRNEFAGQAEALRNFLDTCRYQRAFSRIPFIAEFECGVWHGFHDYVGALTPNHYRLMGSAALLAGIQGLNWYMFAGRDNWYYCPINERGELRPELAEVFQSFHRVLRELDPPTLTKCCATAAVLEPVHVATDRILRENPVLTALHAADVDFEVFDPELAAVQKPLMFYASADWLSRASQARLAAYMEAGGTLVVFQGDYPQRDERFQPHNGLDVAPPTRILSPLGKKVELALGAHVGVAEGAVWCWDAPPGAPLTGTQVAGRQQAVENADKWMVNYIGRQWTCGYRQPRGRGALVVVGLPPTADLVRSLHRWLGRPMFAQAELAGVTTGLFTRDGAYYLIATSLLDADTQVRIQLDGVALPNNAAAAPLPKNVTNATLPEDIVVRDLWSGQERVQRRDDLTVSLARHSGGAWRLTPARDA